MKVYHRHRIDVFKLSKCLQGTKQQFLKLVISQNLLKQKNRLHHWQLRHRIMMLVKVSQMLIANEHKGCRFPVITAAGSVRIIVNFGISFFFGKFCLLVDSNFVFKLKHIFNDTSYTHV